jgi:hypothetical protein
VIVTAPYAPILFTTPIVNPAVGGSGPVPIPYLSVSQYRFAPTAMDTSTLVPGGSPEAQTQALADTISRASRWADTMCFGADPAAKGASLAASLSVENVQTRLKGGALKLVCDYRPIIEVLGIDVGPDPGHVESIGESVAAMVSIGRRTITVPYGGFIVGRQNAAAVQGPIVQATTTYVVWSYVAGYPHSSLAAPVEAGATTCVIQSTDGQGGAWGVLPGSQLTVYDGANTEMLTVQSLTPATPTLTTATLTTTPFQNAHTPPSPPDFLPVTAIPPDIQQGVISLTTMLIKTRGARALVMPTIPGGVPSRQALAQAGALEDWEIAKMLLEPYRVRSKVKS